MWRDSGRQVRFFILDGRLTIFVLLFFFHISYVTAVLAVIAMLFFYALEYKGYTIPNAMRAFSVFLSGKKRKGVHWWRKNKL